MDFQRINKSQNVRVYQAVEYAEISLLYLPSIVRLKYMGLFKCLLDFSLIKDSVGMMD